ncbi:WXG100 family type VII secretion target [Yimella sp. cx-51]|uniref:WXG100 family type VII secretion target n=1 Tax=Yimella sp. cx-51 TaxID=2770551 RepID=UPI00165E12D1|nr:WXG100 family type VII secretion target [Yimella sp. cx-51]MBC9956239.1 WXG100 family type VII secretion target [Yimella sp. cx-51]QTH38615.1 WXG100 family type VII secretion target [Yimella sp. cx-51]
MANPGQYTVNAGDIAQHANDVRIIAGQIQGSMDTMRRKLEALQGTWTGAAAGQYATLHADWQRNQGAVRTTLTQIGLALNGASRAYSTTETDVRNSFTPK